jgi:hypothetical protein
MDRTESTPSNCSSVVACMSVAIKATDVFAQPLLSNSYLYWLHSSGFQQTCHSISDFNLLLFFNLLSV